MSVPERFRKSDNMKNFRETDKSNVNGAARARVTVTAFA